MSEPFAVYVVTTERLPRPEPLTRLPLVASLLEVEVSRPIDQNNLNYLLGDR